MPSQEKKEKVKQIKKWFEKSDSLLVLHYRGLKVSEANELREQVKGHELRAPGAQEHPYPHRARGHPEGGRWCPCSTGPSRSCSCSDDPAPVARTLREFSKGRKEFYLLGGMLEGRVLTGQAGRGVRDAPVAGGAAGAGARPMAAPLAAFVASAPGRYGSCSACSRPSRTRRPRRPRSRSRGRRPQAGAGAEPEAVAETGGGSEAAAAEADAGSSRRRRRPQVIERKAPAKKSVPTRGTHRGKQTDQER